MKQSDLFEKMRKDPEQFERLLDLVGVLLRLLYKKNILDFTEVDTELRKAYKAREK